MLKQEIREDTLRTPASLLMAKALIRTQEATSTPAVLSLSKESVRGMVGCFGGKRW